MDWHKNHSAQLIVIILLDFLQNTTIEERVSLLEIQVVEIEEDLTDLGDDMMVLERNVDFLFDETVIQDERIFNLEQTSIGILGDLELVEDDVESKFFKIEK